MASSVSEMKKKLLLVERQFSKGYGVYSLDPDKKGQYSAFLRKHNLKPTMEAVKRIGSVKDALSKDSSRQEMQAAQSLIEKWHSPLNSLDKLREKKPMKKASLLRK